MQAFLVKSTFPMGEGFVEFAAGVRYAVPANYRRLFLRPSTQKREPLFRMTLGEIRRRPPLPGRFQPSTISVLRLNFCVRDGNRWIPQAIVTGNCAGPKASCCCLSSPSLRLPSPRLPLKASLPLPLSFPLSLRSFGFAPSKPHRSLWLSPLLCASVPLA